MMVMVIDDDDDDDDANSRGMLTVFQTLRNAHTLLHWMCRTTWEVGIFSPIL